MGFMDKVKAAAQDAAAQAKVATNQAQTKIEQVQTQKKMDDVAKQLGYQIYRERTQGQAASDADRLIEEIRGLEAALAAEQASGAPAAAAPVSHTDAAPPPPASTSAAEPTAGDFKL